jgi:hypothetical protein
MFRHGLMETDNVQSMYLGSDDVFSGGVVNSGIKKSNKGTRTGRGKTSPTTRTSTIMGGGAASVTMDNIATDVMVSQQEQVLHQSQAYQDQQLAVTQGAFVASSTLVAQKIEEMTAAMLTELPRYIGQEVSGEFAKIS